VVAGKIYIKRVIFSNNNAIKRDSVGMGGAFDLFSFSQVQLQNGTHLDFFNNMGR